MHHAADSWDGTSVRTPLAVYEYVLASLETGRDIGVDRIEKVHYLLLVLQVWLHHLNRINILQRVVGELWIRLVEQILWLATLGANDVKYASIIQESFVVRRRDSADQNLSAIARMLRDRIRQVLCLDVWKAFLGDLLLHEVVNIRVAQVQLLEQGFGFIVVVDQRLVGPIVLKRLHILPVDVELVRRLEAKSPRVLVDERNSAERERLEAINDCSKIQRARRPVHGKQVDWRAVLAEANNTDE